MLCNTNDMINSSASALHGEAADVRAGTGEIARRHDEEHAPIYAAHDLSTRLHSMRSEARLVAAQGRKRRREGRLRGLGDRTGRQRGEAGEMRTETDRIREERAEMDRREEEDDEETVALNMQIKSVLAKVRLSFAGICACICRQIYNPFLQCWAILSSYSYPNFPNTYCCTYFPEGIPSFSTERREGNAANCVLQPQHMGATVRGGEVTRVSSGTAGGGVFGWHVPKLFGQKIVKIYLSWK